MLRNYLKMAIKVLLRRKQFTAISLFGIGFTLLALLVVAALIDHALGPVGPEREQARIYVTGGTADDPGGDVRQPLGLGPRLLDRFFGDLPGAEAMSIFLDPARVRSYRESARLELGLKRTDAAYWRILRFDFVEGGPFTGSDVEQAREVVVISDSLRGKLFDGAPALGRMLELDGQRLRVVGVVRAVSPMRPNPWADAWAPITTSPRLEHQAELSENAQAIVLAARGADMTRMRQEADLRAARYDPPDPRRHGRVHVSLRTTLELVIDEADHIVSRGKGAGSYAGKVWRLSRFALLVSLAFMLLPAVNLINLNVSRILERASEIGVRKSFGASSRALVGQFVVENVVLTLAGSGLALLAAVVALDRLSATGLFGAEPLVVSFRVFLVGLVLALLFGLVSGVYPAWKMSRLQPLAALRGAVR